MKNTHKLYTDVIAKSGSKNEPLEVTENGTYEAPKGTGYSPVKVNVPQTAESGTLKSVLDATKSTQYLFRLYNGNSVNNLIKFSDTSNVENMSNMFYQCNSLTTIPQLDTSKVTDMRYIFGYCYNLTTVPQLDTSQVIYMDQIFYECHNLTSVPQLDTSKVTSMSSAFYRCYKLTSIPQLDTSNNTSFRFMFDECKNLESIPKLNTSKATEMEYMFYKCTSLTIIPQLDTSSATNMSYMFYDCSMLTSVPALDASKCTNFNYMFTSCSKLTSIGMYGFTRSIDISKTALEHDAIVAFLNQAGTAYDSSQKITMGSTKLALLSNEEKAIATNKGWTLA